MRYFHGGVRNYVVLSGYTSDSPYFVFEAKKNYTESTAQPYLALDHDDRAVPALIVRRTWLPSNWNHRRGRLIRHYYRCSASVEVSDETLPALPQECPPAKSSGARADSWMHLSFSNFIRHHCNFEGE
jgi:hypothetical protein